MNNDAPGTGYKGSALAGGARGRIAAFVLIALLAAIAVQAARLGIAETLLWRARVEIQRWGSRAASPEELARAEGLLSEGLRYAPRHPSALEEKAGLQLRQVRFASEARTAVEHARAAYTHYRLALAENPTAALSWGRLALAKLYLSEVDEELLSALRRSVALGARDPGVPELVPIVGLALWPRLDEDLRQGVVRALRVSASRDASAALALAASYGRFDLICDISSLRALAQQTCAASGGSG